MINRKIAGAILFTFLGMGGYWYFFFSTHRNKNPMQATPVVVMSTHLKTFHDKFEALGSLYANESTELTANVTEIIKEILFSDGQYVHKGEIIALLDQDEERAQLKAAVVQLEEHKREQKRLSHLLTANTASKREYDERTTLVKTAEYQIEGIKARIADRTIRAPFSGLLGIRRISAGTLIQPGQAITTLDDTSQVKIDFHLPAHCLTFLKLHMDIEAKSKTFPGKIFKGKVHAIHPRIHPETRTVLARAIIPNPHQLLKPGLLMQVMLLYNQRKALTIPEEAIYQKKNKHFVYVVDPHTSTSVEREVVIGLREEGEIEIIDGVSESELVIVRGTHIVSNGRKVTITDVWDKARPPHTGNFKVKT